MARPLLFTVPGRDIKLVLTGKGYENETTDLAILQLDPDYGRGVFLYKGRGFSFPGPQLLGGRLQSLSRGKSGGAGLAEDPSRRGRFPKVREMPRLLRQLERAS
jgi:hypothetical protein